MTKTDFDAKLLSLNNKITQNETKHLLVENELNKLKTFDSYCFIGKSHFEEDGTHILKHFLLHSILNMFQNGNLKDYLMKVLRQFLRLIIALIQH